MAFAKINNFISKNREKETERGASLKTAAMPDGHRAYVVGDIHGRDDLLCKTLDSVQVDNAKRSPARSDLVFLGDYVDRGSMSRAVVERILNLDLPQFNIVTLLGNHESAMLSFMTDPVRNKRWLHYGGEATLRSYGVEFNLKEFDSEKIKAIGDSLAKSVPDNHKSFLRGLAKSYSAGDYFFAHAGVNPKKPLNNQKLRDLLWIRDEFLLHDKSYEKVIVHGHSITQSPEFKNNRIGIDTGAFYSNNLTCLVLEGTNKEIL